MHPGDWEPVSRRQWGAVVPVRWHDDGESRPAWLRGNLRNVSAMFRLRFGSSRQAALVPAVDEGETAP